MSVGCFGNIGSRRSSTLSIPFKSRGPDDPRGAGPWTRWTCTGPLSTPVYTPGPRTVPDFLSTPLTFPPSRFLPGEWLLPVLEGLQRTVQG